MPEFKKNHYIPKSYLRLFSENQINFHSYLIKSDSFSLNIPVDSQCQKPYLYGREGEIEKLLSNQEDSFVRLIKDISKNPGKYYKGLKEDIYFQIITMICLQYNRTFDNVQNAKQLSGDTRKLEQKRLKEKNGLTDEVSIVPFALKSLMYGIESAVLFLDLKIALIENVTNIGFVTSDTPVIIYNLLFEKHLKDKPFGLASKGLLVFYPISSNQLIILYDPKSYILECENGCAVKTSQETDIEQLNGLHIANCLNSVYFKAETQKFHLENIKADFLKYRKPKVHVKETVTPGSTLEKGSSVIQGAFPKPTIGLNLSFLTINEDNMKAGYLPKELPKDRIEANKLLVRSIELLNYLETEQPKRFRERAWDIGLSEKGQNGD